MGVYGESLDPGRPLVLCHWRSNDGEDHGHGMTLGTRSETEAAAVLAERSRHRLSQAHARGSHNDHKRHGCPACEAAA